MGKEGKRKVFRVRQRIRGGNGILSQVCQVAICRKKPPPKCKQNIAKRSEQTSIIYLNDKNGENSYWQWRIGGESETESESGFKIKKSLIKK